jgi:hypothetical protein
VGDGHIGCLVAGLFNATVLQEDMAQGYSWRLPEELAEEEAAGGSRGSSSSSSAAAEGAWVASEAWAAAVAAVKEEEEGSGSGSGSGSSSSSSSSAPGKKRRRSQGSAQGQAANRLLAANPSCIRVGSTIALRVSALSHSSGMLLLHGSFQQAVPAEPAEPAPAAPSSKKK